MPIPQLSNKTKSPQNWRKKRIRRASTRYKTKASWQRKPIKRRQIKISKTTLREFFSKKNIIKWAVIVFLFFIFFMFITTLIVSRNLPNPNKLMDRKIAESTKIYDRTGEDILYEVHGSEKRTLVDLNDIPQFVKDATIAIEDKDFYKHGGFSIWAIFRTAVTNIIFGQKAGGSTLTQQFIKNAILTSEKKYSRKIKEIILAYKIEKKFSKDEIMQMYLNEIPYGSSAYGIEAASRHYFGKSVQDINLAEAAVLTALPQAPTKYSPYGQNKDLLINRQHLVLDQMVKQEYISKEEAIVAENTKLEFKERIDNITAPHFVMYIKEILAEEYGEKAVEQGGYKIITTLDLYKQEIAEKVIEEIGEKNAENYNASNAALVSIDPKTGQVVAMVGSRDYFNDDIDGQVNVTMAPRQPGSSFKPMVYTAAWQKGYTPDTMVYDVITNFSDNPSKPYEPHNYDDTEHGPVSLRQALQGSLNIASVKTLYLAGIKNVLKLAEALGYSTLSTKDTNRLGLSLVLGGGEVKLIDHTNAYGVLAREGLMHEPVFILKIEDKEGKVLEEWEETPPKRVLDSNIARITNSVLSDNSARAYIFGENNYLTLPNRPVAAKTGTTNDYRDAWTIGYTPSLVTGVWAGNNDNSKMNFGAGGSQVAAPIWNSYMRQILNNTPIEAFKQPSYDPEIRPILRGEGFAEKKVKIDKASGLLATEYTPDSYIVENVYVQTHSLLYYIDKDQPQNFYPKNTEKDPQFDRWESRVKEWIVKKQEQDENFVVDTPPSEYDNIHIPANLPVFSVDLKNNQLVKDQYLSINLKASSPRGIDKAKYYINDNLFTISSSFPFGLNRSLNILPNGIYKLGIMVCDDIDNCSKKDFNINLQLEDNNKQAKIIASWASPADGINLEKDSSIELKINLINPENVSVIRFYYSANDNPQLIENKYSIDETIEGILWKTKSIAPGVYELYAEADNWQGQTAITDKIEIKIE
ncbi:MAG: penicillin-binding protein [bacterium]